MSSSDIAAVSQQLLEYATVVGYFLCVSTVIAFFLGCVAGYKAHGASKRADEQLKKYEAAQKELDGRSS